MANKDIIAVNDVSEAAAYSTQMILAQIDKGTEDRASVRPNERQIAGIAVTGPPGIGKTACLVQHYVDCGFKVFVLSCGVVDEIIAFQGLPQVTTLDNEFAGLQTASQEAGDGIMKVAESKEVLHTKWAKPAQLAVFDKLQEGERGVFILDDFHLVKGAALMELFTNDRTINGHQIPHNVGVVMIGNTIEDNAGAQELFAPVHDRIASIHVNGVDSKKWIQNYAEPRGISQDIIQYISQNPSEFWKPGVGIEAATDHRPGPRSWENFDVLRKSERTFSKMAELQLQLPNQTPDQLKLIQESIQFSSRLTENNLQNAAAGYIGHEAGLKFSSWMNIYRKYPLDKALQDQKPLKLTDDDLRVAVERYAYELAEFTADLDGFLCQSAADEVREKVQYLDKKTQESEVITSIINAPKGEPLTRKQLQALSLLRQFSSKTAKDPTKIADSKKIILPFPSEILHAVLKNYSEAVQSGKGRAPKSTADVTKALRPLFEEALKPFSAKLPSDMSQKAGAKNNADLHLRLVDFAGRLTEAIHGSDKQRRNSYLSTFLGKLQSVSERRYQKLLGEDAFGSEVAKRVGTASIVLDIVVETTRLVNPTIMDSLTESRDASSADRVAEMSKKTGKGLL